MPLDVTSHGVHAHRRPYHHGTCVYSLSLHSVSAAAAELGAMIGVNHTVLAVAVRVRGMPATQCSVRFAQ